VSAHFAQQAVPPGLRLNFESLVASRGCIEAFVNAWRCDLLFVVEELLYKDSTTLTRLRRGMKSRREDKNSFVEFLLQAGASWVNSGNRLMRSEMADLRAAQASHSATKRRAGADAARFAAELLQDDAACNAKIAAWNAQYGALKVVEGGSGKRAQNQPSVKALNTLEGRFVRCVHAARWQTGGGCGGLAACGRHRSGSAPTRDPRPMGHAFTH